MQKNQLIYEFQKNAIEMVRLEFATFQGKELINLRVFYPDLENGNEWKPTKKGITMSADLIPDLKEAVDKAYEQWKEGISVFAQI
jgi:hypothetical protein